MAKPLPGGMAGASFSTLAGKSSPVDEEDPKTVGVL
jgi:hypothetical protein